jgi:hypothetical protein
MRRFLFALFACAALIATATPAKADWVLTLTPQGWAYVYYDPTGTEDPPPPPSGPWKLMYQIAGYWFGIY